MVTRREELLHVVYDAARGCGLCIPKRTAGVMTDAILDSLAKIFDEYGHDPFAASAVADTLRGLKEERI
jgi:hypothetical protein